jgi:biopolymer transport protein ExbB/TolQ
MFVGAPAETRYAAILALEVGIAGLAWSLVRRYQLRSASHHLRAIEPSADSDANWERVANAVSLVSFRRMMKRLNRARQVGSSEPEATWRAGFDLVADAEERIEAVIRSLASVAVLFGLAGTVLGFARLAGPLLEIQRGASSISISSELSGAFLATLAGIAAATMILLGAVPLMRAAEDTWLSAVEDVGRLILIPSLPRPLTKIGDIVLEELKRKLDAVRDAWMSALLEPARELSSIASSAQVSVGKLGEALSGVGPETLKELAGSARSMKTSANSIAKSSAHYESSITELGKISSALEGTLGGLKGALTDNNSRVERMEQTLAGAREEVERQGKELAASLNSMASAFGRLEASVLKRTEQDSGIFDKAGQTVEAVEEHLKQLAKGCNAVAD